MATKLENRGIMTHILNRFGTVSDQFGPPKLETEPFGLSHDFPNLNPKLGLRFGSNRVCIGLRPNFPNTSLPPLGKIPEALTQVQYPAVKFWRRAEYNRECKKNKGNTNALATARPKHGRPRALEYDSDDPNNISWDPLDPNKIPKHPYIETVNRCPASRETLSAIGTKVRRIWQTFLEKGIAPVNWGQVTHHACEYFNQEMLNTFIKFRLCENNWKLDLWISRSYSSWYQNHFKLKGKKKKTATNDADTYSLDSANVSASIAGSSGSDSTATGTSSTGSPVSGSMATGASSTGSPVCGSTVGDSSDTQAGANSGEGNSTGISDSAGNPAGTARRSLHNPFAQRIYLTVKPK
jgi:hypothetical protein